MVNDNYVSIKVVDLSQVTLIETPVTATVEVLAPILSSKGKSKVHRKISSYSEFLSVYGDDVFDFKWGQQNLNASQVILGGGSVLACRLLPDDASKANIVFEVHYKKNSSLPVYERTYEDGPYKYKNGERIPVTTTNEENEVVPVTTKGFDIKVVAVQSTDATRDSVVREYSEEGEDEHWTAVPLFKFESSVLGTAGNMMGFSISNDFTKDKISSDGRRYELVLYSVDSKANVITNATSYFFSFNPDAVVSGSTVSEFIGDVYDNLDVNNFYNLKDLQIEPYNDNYDTLVTALSEFGDDKHSIDFISLLNKNGNPYDNFVFDDDSLKMSTSRVFLKGGHDGSFHLGQYVSIIDEDGNPTQKKVDAQHIEDTKESLLEDYFRCEYDTELSDCKLVQGGYVFDANYSLNIKGIIAGEFVVMRDDVFAMLDCGICETPALAAQQAVLIRNRLDSSIARHAIFPHSGLSINTTRRYNVTQTYEMAYMLPNVYKTKYPFAIIGGMETGLVSTMLMSWTIQTSGDVSLMESHQLNYVRKMANDSSGIVSSSNKLAPTYMMAEYTQYSAASGNSTQLSMRNAIVICDLTRLVRKILVKWSYRSEGAAYAMNQAEKEFNSNVYTRYPSEIIFEQSFNQTERDLILGYCSAVISVYFPSVIKTWNVTIETKRVGQ